MSSRRNVLFIIIDQLRADCITGPLAPFVNLPNLRALMAESVSFQRHYSVTNPCGPSRASILTGRYAMNHRSVRNGTPMAHGISNIAREARKVGYEPMLFGYTDSSLDPREYHPNDPAIHTYERVLPGFHEKTEMRLEESYPWRAHLKSKGYDIPDYSAFYVPAAQSGKEPSIDDPAFYRAEDSDTAFLANECLKELSVRQNKNWFAHLTFIRPHPPLVAPSPYNQMYKGDALPAPTRHRQRMDEAALHPFLAAGLDRISAASVVNGFPDLEETDETIQTLRAIYLGLATEVDAHVGRVLKFLDDSGQRDNTLVVVTADHGEMLGDHHTWGKQTIYDAAYHTPLIIRDPLNCGTAGSCVDHMTEAVDVTPTILDWIGADIPAGMDGRALTPFLKGDAPSDWRTHSYSELDFGEPDVPTLWQQRLGVSLGDANLAILREDRFTLVHFNGGLPPLLFDREGDGEMRNLAEDPDHAPTLLRLTQKMLNHRMRYADSTLSGAKITAAGPIGFRN